MQLKLLLTIQETMAETGWSRQTLYRKIKRGELKASKSGSRTYIKGSDLLEHINALPRLNTSNEVNAAA